MAGWLKVFLLVFVTFLLALPNFAGASSKTQISDLPGVTTPPTSTPVELAPGVVLKSGMQYGVDESDARTPELFDAYLPAPSEQRAPAVILIHGGGWVSGSRTDLAPEAARFAAAGFAAFTIDYRLETQQHGIPWNDPIDDVQEAIRYIASNADTFGVDPNRIGILGASAGGWLAGMIATLGTDKYALGESPSPTPSSNAVKISVVVTWSGIFDLTTLQPRQEGELPSGCDNDPNCLIKLDPGGFKDLTGCDIDACPDQFSEASPVNHVTGITTPMYMFNSDDELVPVAQPQAMGAVLSAKSVANDVVIIPGSLHAQQYADTVWNQTLSFLTQYLGESVPSASSPPSINGSKSETKPSTESDTTWLAVVVAVAAVLALLVSAIAWRRHRHRSARSKHHKK